MALIGLIFDAETTGADGAAKQQKVIDDIMREVEDGGGIEVKNKIILSGLRFALPFLIKFLVWKLNELDFLGK